MEYKMFQRNVKSTEEIRHEQKRRLYVSLFFMTMMVILSALSLRDDISTLVSTVFLIASLLGLMCVVMATKVLTMELYVDVDDEFTDTMQSIQKQMKQQDGEGEFLLFIVNVMRVRNGLKLTPEEYHWIQQEFETIGRYYRSAILESEFNLRAREVINISSYDDRDTEESSHV